MTIEADLEPARLRIDPRSKITILGTSNLHDWTCSTSSIDATIEVPRTESVTPGAVISRIDVTIPVGSLECGEPKMNDALRKAMKADTHPDIRFEMTAYEARGVGEAAGGYEAMIKGSLTINGVTRPIEFGATVTPDGHGGVRADGRAEIHTPDYGVAPVKAFLGALRTGKNVTIVLSIIGTLPEP